MIIANDEENVSMKLGEFSFYPGTTVDRLDFSENETSFIAERKRYLQKERKNHVRIAQGFLGHRFPSCLQHPSEPQGSYWSSYQR